MVRLGMDVEVVEGVGRKLNRQAANLTSVVAAVDQLIARSASVWDGPRAGQFVDAWRSTHRRALLEVSSSVGGLGTSALHNAQEQRTVSGSGGASSGGSEPGGAIGDWLRGDFAAGMRTMEGIDKFLATYGVAQASVLAAVLGHTKSTYGAAPYPALYKKLFGGSDFMRYNSSLQHHYSKSLTNLLDSAPARGFDLIGRGYTVVNEATNVYDKFFNPNVTATPADQIEAGGSAAGSALKMSKNPVAYLVGANVTAWSMVAAEATKVDFSSEGLTQTWNYAVSNPGVVVEEFGNAAKEMVTERIWKIFG